MPWLPELFTAPALARVWEDERRRRLALVPFFVGEYQRALADGDAGAVTAAFEPDALIREPAGRDHAHHGADQLRALYRLAAARIYDDVDPPVTRCPSDPPSTALRRSVVRPRHGNRPGGSRARCHRGPGSLGRVTTTSTPLRRRPLMSSRGRTVPARRSRRVRPRPRGREALRAASVRRAGGGVHLADQAGAAVASVGAGDDQLRAAMTEPRDRYDALLVQAAHRLADTLAPYGVLTRDTLADFSGAARWSAIGFDGALRWAVDHDYVRRLDGDLYEIGKAAELDEASRAEEREAGWWPNGFSHRG
jgi:hypothetical protein